MPPKKQAAAPRCPSSGVCTVAPEREEPRRPPRWAGRRARAAAAAAAAVAAAPAAAAAGASSGRPGQGTTTEEDFITVVVAPKLTFQIGRRAEWKTVQGIAQEELRLGFLSRFPPAMWMSCEKLIFRPALPPSSAITEDTRSLVYKLVSDDVPDERVMLGILRELERCYEGIIRRAVAETRSEALQQQEEAEQARREHEKQVKELKKDNKSMHDQLQPVQKRLFLLEQEKDQLRREQQQTNDRLARLEREGAERAQEQRREQEALHERFATMQRILEGILARAVAAEAAPTAASAAAAGAGGAAGGCAAAAPRGPAPPERQGREAEAEATEPASAGPAVSATGGGIDGTSTPEAPPEADLAAGCLAAGAGASELADVAWRVDGLEQQMGALRAWLMRGSHLLLGGALAGARGAGAAGADAAFAW